MVREEDTGKSRGFGFLKYEDARSCVLAVDNFVGTKVCGRSLRVDHVEKYRLPKNLLAQEEEEGEKKKNLGAGHAYQDEELSNKYNIHQGQDLFAPPPQSSDDDDDSKSNDKRKKKKRKSRHHKSERSREKRKRSHKKREKKEKRHKKERR